ncbi:MAG: sulfatase [Anaerolineae bacterium]|nr:sulfatase [Anaerolineae bacterium]GIK28375.1 MAG: sulfatase [Chloroflexota bacterium]
MKAIMVMFDSLNRHMLPAYGSEWIHAPNFQRLAERTVTFERSYAGSMPCMPARRELHTGRYNFLHRSWGPMEPFDVSMPEILKQNGVYTHLATDHQHYFEDGGSTYHTRYSSWEFARGQEGDPWKGQLADPAYHENLKKMQIGMFRQDIINRQHQPTEADQPQALTFKAGLEFIETNHAEDNWFLQIETFDPHEPFFTHQVYKDLYPHAYDGPDFDWPDYTRVTETPEQVAHVRYEYAALVSMCDAYLGRVLDAMDKYNLWDDTLLIVNTDHGFMLGEHDWWAKTVQPWYEELIHTPLFIWDPRSRKQGERRESLVQTIDLPATLLEFFGQELPPSMQGRPLRPVIEDDSPIRETALFGIYGGHVSITDGRFVYMRAPATEANAPLYEYTLMPTHMREMFSVQELQHIELAEPFTFTQGCRLMKIAGRGNQAHQFGTLLFDLQADPGQQNPLVDDALERQWIAHLIEAMRANDAPPEQYERLGLPQDGPVEDAHLLLNRQHVQALSAMEPEFMAVRFPVMQNNPHLLHTALERLYGDHRIGAVLDRHFPNLREMPNYSQLKQLTLGLMRLFIPRLMSPEKMQVVAHELDEIDLIGR